jgi:spermidine synthase
VGPAGIAVALLLGVAPLWAQALELLHSERSLYRDVLVYEADGQRCMCFTRNCRIGRQSCIALDNSGRLELDYTRTMSGALYLKPEPRSILIVGLGGGSLPGALAKLLPGARIDVVEIDAAVTRAAGKYFGFKPGERMNVIEADGRVYVKRAVREKRQYDLIMLDAFDHEYIPEHLLTEEFLREVKSIMAPGGVLAANTFSSSRLYDHESTTYAAVFGRFYNLKRTNRVILVMDAPFPTREQLVANSKAHATALAALGVEADDLLPFFSTKPDWDTRARVLTDQYSPANLLNMKR